MYTLAYSDKVLKQLEKLPKETQDRVLKTLQRITVRPHAHVKKLFGSPYFRLRVGDYRVILNIVENKLIILVIELGHRKNIYK